MYQNISTCLTGKLTKIDGVIASSCVRGNNQIEVPDYEIEYDQKVGNLVLKLVSTLEKIDSQNLTGTTRGRSDVCLARQMAMYLIHTVFSVPYHRVAYLFHRDRTTISHACRLVEDLRDNEEFDKRLETMENLLVSARALGELEKRQLDHE